MGGRVVSCNRGRYLSHFICMRWSSELLRETFHKSLHRRMLPSIELLKRCLLFMGMNSENKYAHSKRDRHKCGVFFNYIGS